MYILLVSIILIILIVAYKYHIDTKSTIEELIKDRNKFRQHSWGLIKDKDRRKEVSDKIDQPYHELKAKIGLLINDLTDTNFNDFDNIKEEVLSALSEIDSYGDNVDQG